MKNFGSYMTILENLVDPQDMKIAIYDNGNRFGYHVASFNSMEKFHRFVRMRGLPETYTVEESRRNWDKQFSFCRLPHTIYGNGKSFNRLEDLPENAHPILALSNGSIVTCYFTNDGSTVRIYRPNPNCKDIYHPLPLMEHIAYQRLYGCF